MFLEVAGLCTDFFVTHSTNNADTNFFNINIMKTPIWVDKIGSECDIHFMGLSEAAESDMFMTSM